MISSQLRNVDSLWEDSLSKFHSQLISGMFKEGEIVDDLKTSLSFQRNKYNSIEELYTNSRLRMKMSGRADSVIKLDTFMLAFLQQVNKGLNPKNIADLDEEKIRVKEILSNISGSVADLEKFAVSINKNKLTSIERNILDTVLGLVNKETELKKVYYKNATSLTKRKDRNQLEALNNLISDYIKSQNDQTKNPYFQHSKDELFAKQKELNEYICSLNDQESNAIASYKNLLTNQKQYENRKINRRNELRLFTLEQLELVNKAINSKL